MKDIREVHYKARDPKNDWVIQGYYTSVIPILQQPAITLDDVYGAGFQLKYKNENYIVTAKHVIDIQNPTLFFQDASRKGIFVDTNYFQKIGIDWICHESEDIAVLRLKIPELTKRIINTTIQPNLTKISIQTNQIVKHLGYPDKITGTWKNTNQKNTIPSGIDGRVLSVYQNKIIIETQAHKGDSGGPLFLKIGNMAKLIGVISKTKVLKNDITGEDEMYMGETTAIPMHLVYELIDKNQ